MGNRKKILIVEDETMNALALASYLEGLGCDVLDFTATGEKAILMAKSEKPDILFMDISLSGKMDGIEAAETIARNAPIAIVFMTGYSNQSIIDRASALAPAAYLVKPFDFSAIDGILASIG